MSTVHHYTFAHAVKIGPFLRSVGYRLGYQGYRPHSCVFML